MERNNEFLDWIAEQSRLSHAGMLKHYLQVCGKYKRLKATGKSDEMKRYFDIIDLHFYDETGKINWQTICPLMPQNFENCIKKVYNTLSENEIRLCCLLFFDVLSNDIADILPFKLATVHTITHRVKQKTGIKDIKVALMKILQDSIFFTEPKILEKHNNR